MDLKRKLEKALKSGNDLERYLPAFFTECASANQIYAGMSFAMHYYDFYEAMLDQPVNGQEEKSRLLTEFNCLVKTNLLEAFDGEAREAAVRKLHQMREQIMERMQVLTAYTDRFLLYEYVLNRVELNFETELEDVEEDVFANELLSYIFDTKDNVVINRRIQEMLSQLPVRMTKGRFFDLLRGSLSIYLGAEKKSLEDYIYMLRCAAGIYHAKGKEERYPELKEALQLFKDADYRELSKEDYDRLEQNLESVVARISEETNFYYNLQELCNVFYALLLNYPYAAAEASGKLEELLPVIREAAEGFEQEHPETIREETVRLFEKTEGKLEQYADAVLKQQGLLHEIKESYSKEVESMMLGRLFECLLLSEQLLSNSLFIELDSKGCLEQTKVDREYLEQRLRELSEELSGRLKEQPQILNRAMIAGVLKEMPVFFQDQKEVFDYIRSSLSGCHDPGEKIASIRLMRTLMREEI